MSEINTVDNVQAIDSIIANGNKFPASIKHFVIDIGNGREHSFLESARSKKAGKIGNQFRIASI